MARPPACCQWRPENPGDPGTGERSVFPRLRAVPLAGHHNGFASRPGGGPGRLSLSSCPGIQRLPAGVRLLATAPKRSRQRSTQISRSDSGQITSYRSGGSVGRAEAGD